MSHCDMMTARSQHMVEAVGTVTAVNLNQRVVTISHGPIPAINWPAMTMKFPVGVQINLSSFGTGQKVQFTLHRAADGTLPLVELCAATNSSPLAGLCAPEMGHKPHTAQPAHKDDHAILQLRFGFLHRRNTTSSQLTTSHGGSAAGSPWVVTS